jgi:nucleoside-diphosphate-sugar epimerase
VYQKPPSHPVITESTPLANPYWQYSRDKIACENLLMEAYRNDGFPVTIVRPSLTYDTVIPMALGCWNDYTLVDRMKRGRPVIVPGDGTSLWTVTHARDFAKGFVGLMAHGQALGHAFHITSDELLTWNQIYQSLADAAGVSAEFVHVPSDFIADVADDSGLPDVRGSLLGDKSQSVIFDNAKIKRFVPGFCATTRFEQGIRETLNWFEAEPSRMRIVPQNNELLDNILARWNR